MTVPGTLLWVPFLCPDGYFEMKLNTEQIELLRANPGVRAVRSNRLDLTFKLRCELYDLWLETPKEQRTPAVRQALEEAGILWTVTGKDFARDLCKAFRKSGRPSNGAHNCISRGEKRYEKSRATEERRKALLETGKFCVGKNGQGVTFTEEFIEELARTSPESVADGLVQAGIDPELVGPNLIYRLQRRFSSQELASPRPVLYSEEIVQKYSTHPYVRRITARQLVLKDGFFTEAKSLADLPFEEVLTVYGIDPEDLPVSVRTNLYYKLQGWGRQGESVAEDSPIWRQIQERRMAALQKLVERNFEAIRRVAGPRCSRVGMEGRREICRLVQQLPRDPEGEYTVRGLLEKVGISKSSFYAVVKDPEYGTRQAARQEAWKKQEEKDLELIRQVMAYRGMRKGRRQIFMQMPRITGVQLSEARIRKLMHRNGITSGVRGANQSRRQQAKLLKENTKPNLLQRRFKLGRPNQIRLSDVTYLSYIDADGTQKKAYASASIDPVTGKLAALVLSGSNDLALAEQTVDEVAAESSVDGMMFHTDQGSLYLSAEFQKKVQALGMQQSMSKRGCCWDNAPQESFFGHMKDETGCRKAASSYEELAWQLNDYAEYYNHERPQMGRRQMTPLEYEAYLQGLSEEQFALYMAQQEEKYQKMKEKAARRAVQHARNLGVDGVEGKVTK